MWDTLVITYEGSLEVKRNKLSFLVRKYELFEMEENESIQTIFGRFQTIINELSFLGRTYDKFDHIEKLLRSLPRKWRPQVTALRASKNLEKLLLEELIGLLKVHEMELQQDEKGRKQKSNPLRYVDSESENKLSTTACPTYRKHGHFTSKCNHMHKKRYSKTSHANIYGPKSIWGPKTKIIAKFDSKIDDEKSSSSRVDKWDRKSTSGGCHFLERCLVSWTSKRQSTIALSTCEAEYVAAGQCLTQLLWIKHHLEDYNIYESSIPVLCDNTVAISISKNLVLHSRTKHIEIKHHFIRDHVQKGTFDLLYVKTEEQLVDIFTKPLQEDRYIWLRDRLGMELIGGP
uniref:Copia protein n=1 Tax=Cajanus cajan TaxID=3821 RepID=A0A151THL2_CAJCA|nr:Copia protein [Cajanus cajan]